MSRERWPGDPVTLFDGRPCLLQSTPQYAGGSVGWWADVAPVLNANDEPFYGPELGAVERASLEGATWPMDDIDQYFRDCEEVGKAEARRRLRARHAARDSVK